MNWKLTNLTPEENGERLKLLGFEEIRPGHWMHFAKGVEVEQVEGYKGKPMYECRLKKFEAWTATPFAKDILTKIFKDEINKLEINSTQFAR